MTNDIAKKLTKLIIALFVVLLLVVGYIFYQSYESRVDVVNAQREGCERAKKDRNANAQGWRIAQAARLADGQTKVSNKYAEIASGLEIRGSINCDEAFPDATLIP